MIVLEAGKPVALRFAGSADAAVSGKGGTATLRRDGPFVRGRDQEWLDLPPGSYRLQCGGVHEILELARW